MFDQKWQDDLCQDKLKPRQIWNDKGAAIAPLLLHTFFQLYLRCTEESRCEFLKVDQLAKQELLLRPYIPLPALPD